MQPNWTHHCLNTNKRQRNHGRPRPDRSSSCRVLTILFAVKNRVERSTRSSDRATSTTRSWGEILLAKISRGQSGKRSVPSRNSGHPPLSSGIQGQAQPVVRVTVRRSVRVAVRRPAIRRVVVPTATTEHAVAAFKDRSPPMVVTQIGETASFSLPPLSQTRLMRQVVVASQIR